MGINVITIIAKYVAASKSSLTIASYSCITKSKNSESLILIMLELSIMELIIPVVTVRLRRYSNITKIIPGTMAKTETRICRIVQNFRGTNFRIRKVSKKTTL